MLILKTSSFNSEVTMLNDFIKRSTRSTCGSDKNLYIQLCKYVRRMFQSSAGKAREVGIAMPGSVKKLKTVQVYTCTCIKECMLHW